VRRFSRPIFLALFVAVSGIGLVIGIQHFQSTKHSLTLFGNVDIREVEMAFRQSGRLMTMHFEEGEYVKAGALLAELDDQPFNERLDQAQAQYEGAKAQLEKLQHGFRNQEIAQAEEFVHQAEAGLAFAASELERQQSSVNSGATTRQSLDHARTARDQAKAQLGAARQDLNLKREGSRLEDINAAAAQLAGAKAGLEEAQTALSDTRISAPADAIIQSRIREPGSMVNPSAPVYSLALTSPVYLRAYVSETELTKAIPGTLVEVSCDSCSKTYKGTIGFVSARAEFTPKTVETTDLRTDLVYRVRITVQNADEGLRQGMPVTITTQEP
jgi:HlyD family secretion protein